MTHKQQIIRLDQEIGNLIERYRLEYDLGVAEVVGVLNCQIFQIQINAHQADQEDL